MITIKKLNKLVCAFCREHSDYTALQIHAIDSTGYSYRHVVDIAEFQDDHGDDRPEAVVGWARVRMGFDELELVALGDTERAQVHMIIDLNTGAYHSQVD